MATGYGRRGGGRTSFAAFAGRLGEADDEPTLTPNAYAHLLMRAIAAHARAVLPYLAGRDTPLGKWVKGLLARAHKNIVVVALANKLARIAWAVLAHGRGFDAAHAVAA